MKLSASASGVTLYSTAVAFPADGIFVATTLIGAFDPREPTEGEYKMYFQKFFDGEEMVSAKAEIIDYFLNHFSTIPNCMIAYAAHNGIKHTKLEKAPLVADNSENWFNIVKPLVDAGRAVAAMKYTLDCLSEGASVNVTITMPGYIEYSIVDQVILKFPDNLKMLFLAAIFPKGTHISKTLLVRMQCAKEWVERAQAICERFMPFLEFVKNFDGSTVFLDYSLDIIYSMFELEKQPLPEIKTYA